MTSPAPAELGGSLEHTLASERLRVIMRTLSLPDTPQAFIVFLLMLILACGALACHLLLSTAIHENELRLNELKVLNRSIEQETTTLIEEIATSSSLDEGMDRARAMGYESAYELRYILPPTEPATSVSASDAELSKNSSLPIGSQAVDPAAQN